MSTAGTMLSSKIIQTTRHQPHPLLRAAIGCVVGGISWFITGGLMIPSECSGLSFDRISGCGGWYGLFFMTRLCFDGAVLGACIAAGAAVASGVTAPRTAGWRVGMLIGAITGALAVVVLLTAATNNRSGELFEELYYAGVLRRPFVIQLLGGILPGMVCGLVGAWQRTARTASCAACGGSVRLDATRCERCGVAFGTPD